MTFNLSHGVLKVKMKRIVHIGWTVLEEMQPQSGTRQWNSTKKI